VRIWVDVLDGDGGWFYEVDDAPGRNAGPFEVDDATVARWRQIEADYRAMQDELQALCDQRQSTRVDPP
jgi:hypothetical protein